MVRLVCLLASAAFLHCAVLLPCAAVANASVREAAAAPDPQQLCGQAIRQAQFRHPFPPGLLHAIGLVESGRRDPLTGTVQPWPWTVDVEGEGHFYDSEQQAIDAVRQFQAQGRRSIDVGCMQINLLQHPGAFPDLGTAFDPAANALYASDFLSSLHDAHGDWMTAAGLYHSATPELASAYRQRVAAALTGQDLAHATMLAVDTPAPPPFSSSAVFRPPILRPPPPQTGMIVNGRVLGGVRTGRGLAIYRASPVMRRS
jgi:hypothetical protein